MQVYLLPGLGANQLIFEEQTLRQPTWSCLPWATPVPGESLSQYAQRWARDHSSEFQSPFCLVGTSFGGMVALELARHLIPHAVILISSCRSSDGIRPLFRRQALAACALPDTILRVSLSRFGVTYFRQKENLIAQHIDWLQQQVESMDLPFFRWGLQAAAHWQFRSDTPLNAPVFQIHGRNDYAIPLAETDADTIIEDGRHLIQYTHPTQTTEFVLRCLGTFT